MPVFRIPHFTYIFPILFSLLPFAVSVKLTVKKGLHNLVETRLWFGVPVLKTAAKISSFLLVILYVVAQPSYATNRIQMFCSSTCKTILVENLAFLSFVIIYYEKVFMTH